MFKQQTVEQGSRWIDGEDDKYIVARCGESSYVLISLLDGNRYYEPVESLEALSNKMLEDENTVWKKKK